MSCSPKKFITAFNTMEQALIEGQGERRKIEIEQTEGVLWGYENVRLLPVI